MADEGGRLWWMGWRYIELLMPRWMVDGAIRQVSRGGGGYCRDCGMGVAGG